MQYILTQSEMDERVNRKVLEECQDDLLFLANLLVKNKITPCSGTNYYCDSCVLRSLEDGSYRSIIRHPKDSRMCITGKSINVSK